MNAVFVLVCILAALTANAQPPPAEGALESQLNAELGKPSSRASPAARPKEIVSGKVIYSGIVVDLLKTGGPFHLTKPPAPPLYGSPENITMRDWSRGPVSGFTLFAISF